MRAMVNLGRGRKVSEMKTVFAFQISNWGHFGDSKFSGGLCVERCWQQLL